MTGEIRCVVPGKQAIVSSPVPEPVPVVVDQLEIGTAVRHFQLNQRQVDLVLSLAGFGEDAVKPVAQLFSGSNSFNTVQRNSSSSSEFIGFRK